MFRLSLPTASTREAIVGWPHLRMRFASSRSISAMLNLPKTPFWSWLLVVLEISNWYRQQSYLPLWWQILDWLLLQVRGALEYLGWIVVAWFPENCLSLSSGKLFPINPSVHIIPILWKVHEIFLYLICIPIRRENNHTPALGAKWRELAQAVAYCYGPKYQPSVDYLQNLASNSLWRDSELKTLPLLSGVPNANNFHGPLVLHPAVLSSLAPAMPLRAIFGGNRNNWSKPFWAETKWYNCLGWIS